MSNSDWCFISMMVGLIPWGVLFIPFGVGGMVLGSVIQVVGMLCVFYHLKNM